MFKAIENTDLKIVTFNTANYFTFGTFPNRLNTHAQTHTNARTHAHTHTEKQVYIYIYVCVCVCVCMCVCARARGRTLLCVSCEFRALFALM